MSFPIYRGSFGDWSNKTQRYNIEPLNQNDTSVSIYLHVCVHSMELSILNFFFQLEQPHALYQADDSEDEGECGKCSLQPTRNLFVHML